MILADQSIGYRIFHPPDAMNSTAIRSAQIQVSTVFQGANSSVEAVTEAAPEGCAILSSMLLILALGAASLAPLPSARAVLVDETVRVPRSQFRAVRMPVQQRPVTIECDYQSVSGSPVRAVVLTVDDMERMRNQRSYRLLAATGPAAQGALRYHVNRPGDYVLLLENDNSPSTRVRLRVALAFDETASFTPTTLPPAKRRQVVAISLAGFSLVAGFTAWRLLAALRRRSSWFFENPLR
jgi:hypothetical protein